MRCDYLFKRVCSVMMNTNFHPILNMTHLCLCENIATYRQVLEAGNGDTVTSWLVMDDSVPEK